MKAALLVIDMQKEFFKNSKPKNLNDAIEVINATISLFRKKNYPVIEIQHSEPGLTAENPGFATIEDIKLLPSDIHITKTYGNSFNKTPLVAKLKELAVDTILITGYCAEYCVLATYIGAQDYDYKPIIVKESLVSGVPKHIQFVENITSIISYGALKQFLT